MTVNIPQIPQEVIDQLSDGPRTCVERLLKHFATSELMRLNCFSQPSSKLAAVLVLLYEQEGHLRVLLTTRSKALRTHAGQTALPGGKVDETDQDVVATAYREAQEEVNLPRDGQNINTIGILPPFISLHKLLVTPVVALLSQPELLKHLRASEGEVAHIFTHPLESIVNPSLSGQTEVLVPIKSEDWPYDDEFYNTSDSVVQMLANTSYRMHRFRTSASPIKGLTADILIKIAEIAYARPTSYERYAPGQLTNIVDVIDALNCSN